MSNPQALMKQMMTRILQMSKILIHKTKIKQNIALHLLTQRIANMMTYSKVVRKLTNQIRLSRQDEIDTKQQSTANQDKDDASVSKALDAIDDFVSDETDDDKDNQGSNNTDTTNHQSDNDDTSTDSKMILVKHHLLIVIVYLNLP